ncbi:MAG TPA: helix-turn-helix domain-containing protein [Pseudonocardiaceae bacterium]
MRQASGDGRATESLALRVLTHLSALTDELVRTLHEQNPGYRTAVVPDDDLWRSCHDNLGSVLELIAEPAGRAVAETDSRYDAARATGRRRAEQRMPLDDVLRSFRLGGRLVWEALIEQAHADHSVDTDGLLDVATRVWEVVDATSEQVAGAYHAASRDLVRADEQRRAALWEGLLQGRAQEMAFRYEVSRIIGVPVDAAYAVVVADVDPDSDRVMNDWRRALADADIRSAWQVRADTLVGLLALGDPAPSALAAPVSVLRKVLTVPAGLSLVVHGLAEVDAAYRQAVLARRSLPPGHGGLAVLAERLPEALLLSAPALAEQLVRRWLGALLALPAPERRLLLGTLQIWVATGGSIRQTAEAAVCHRNTVINRLQRMQAITGHDFTDPAHQVELALALRASALLAVR